ncbi:hypothetical protein KAI92_04970 [Candidatus Parcubacteria bacterium]|nr:hypothetical protein [Candidatus Parcubacteria bacterium]
MYQENLDNKASSELENESTDNIENDLVQKGHQTQDVENVANETNEHYKKDVEIKKRSNLRFFLIGGFKFTLVFSILLLLHYVYSFSPFILYFLFAIPISPALPIIFVFDLPSYEHIDFFQIIHSIILYLYLFIFYGSLNLLYSYKKKTAIIVLSVVIVSMTGYIVFFIWSMAGM